ncbi:TonB-dependent receptor family protein [Aliikangiella coralliicola]|uniref:TonB-dependent receptor n=1 Tax=Aliikangiella coralliicola TaxID=2592383 RepID=A0A545UC92_9GAMM|nr:TonB-dependent receptor [Aliikangiella coralliicola]TQV87091.1 TonB-dependent receptor [Aliikangiella coralliicola]
MINKNKVAFKLSALTLAFSVAFNGVAQEQSDAGTNKTSTNETSTNEISADEANKQDDAYNQRMLIIGAREKLNTEAGSATVIDEEALEKFEYDDIHRILAQVPGINIRQEDGYGLRPNIGFRGVTPERSKKINILEDGILIGPAPYSAPAAYYFPMVSRLTSVEVFKGPSAILYGPNTVAGTLNLQTRQISGYSEGMIDLSVGSDGYRKTHGYVMQSKGNLGFLFEGLNTQTDGFKELPDGADTGFDKNDFITKVRYDLNGQDYDQVFEVKLGYADEVSDETYLGLTDADFAVNPYRRYAATQLGKMDWEHEQFQFNHFLEGKSFDLTTRVYRNNFERAWRKINNFRQSGNPATQRSLQEILQSPEDGINAIYYQVLTGEKDSEGLFEQLLIGTNDRSFYSQGVQSDLRWKLDWADLSHDLKIGIRYHEDEIERNHTEDSFDMRSGQLVSTGNSTELTTANTELSEVWSVYLQDTLNFDEWEFTFGIRGEFIDSFYQNNLAGQENDWLKKSTTVWLPGASVFYSLDSQSGLFMGVHRGFIPTSPKQAPEIDIEESINLELGYRYHSPNTQVDLVGFMSDFKNLTESCTASTSSACFSIIDQQFNAGKVDVYGLEASFAHRFGLTKSIDFPFSVVYTYTNAEFQETFSSDFALWGNVTAGDPVPYLPENQLTISFGLEAAKWRTNLLARYTNSMFEAAGTDVALSGVSTDSLMVVDFSAAYDFTKFGSLYLKVDNLSDETKIISRRPFGARPSKPRQVFLGYKYRW